MRKADVMIGMESERDEVEIKITFWARVAGRSKTIGRRSTQTGFQDFEAGDFLIEESKRGDWAQATPGLDWRAVAGYSPSATMKEKSSVCATCCATTM